MRLRNRGGVPRRRRAALAALVLSAVVAATAVGLEAATPLLKSAWRDHEVKIDGMNDEWQANTTYLKDEQLSVGLLNDGEFLYAMVSTSEPRRRMQLLTAGLTLWIDASGRKKQTFGIVVPGTGFGGGMLRRRGGDEGQSGQSGEPGEPGQERPDPNAALERLNQPVTWFELVGPGSDDRRRLELAAGPGIEISRGVHEGMVTYEFKIPLTRSEAHEYAIESAAGRTVAVGLETPKPEAVGRGGRGGGERGGDGGGGGGGRIGGRGGFGGGMGGGGRRGGFGGGGESGRGGERAQPLQPLKIWMTATLATQGQ